MKSKISKLAILTLMITFGVQAGAQQYNSINLTSDKPEVNQRLDKIEAVRVEAETRKMERQKEAVKVRTKAELRRATTTQNNTGGTKDRIRTLFSDKQSGTTSQVRSEKRTELQEKASERKEEARKKLNERAKDRIKAYIERIFKRLNSALDRMEKLADRIDSRIEKLEENDRDTGNTSALLAEARTEIANGRSAIEDIRNRTGATLENDDPKQAFGEIRDLIEEAKKAIRAAHTKLVEAIKELKASAPTQSPDSSNESGGDETES